MPPTAKLQPKNVSEKSQSTRGARVDRNKIGRARLCRAVTGLVRRQPASISIRSPLHKRGVPCGELVRVRQSLTLPALILFLTLSFVLHTFGASVQYHCAGGSQLAADTHLTTLHKALALRSTTNFQKFALTRFSGLLTNSLRLANKPASDSLLAPLLSDVVETESLGSVGGALADGPGFILALHLQPPRAQVWQDNLAKIFGGSGEKFTSQEFSGQRWHTGGSNFLWIIPAREWLLVGRGDEFYPLQVEYLNQIKSQGRPAPALKGNWLEADLDSTRLGGWFRLLQPARLKLTVTPSESDLQINARVLESTAIPWKSDPWQIPTNLIQGQIISFTVGQNLAAFLKVNPAFAPFAGNPLTNQFYFWALDGMPLLNYMAWPAPHASNVLEQIAVQAPGALNPVLKRFNGTELVWNTNAHKLFLQNMRLFVPALEAVQTNDGQFLFLAGFPRAIKSTPAPDALLSQVEGRTDLVYYDWELTGRRLAEWGMLGKMIANRATPQHSDAEDAGFDESEWLGGLAAMTSNTVTEITRVAPNELFLMRKAPVGLTAVELMLLADWLSDANTGPIHAPPSAGIPAPFPGHP